jgi:hypothetical protein
MTKRHSKTKIIMEKIWEPEYIYHKNNHSSWGNNITFHTWETRHISGHLARRPKIGDALIFPMENGEFFIFRFTKVEYMRDPHDMFFAYVEDVRYMEKDEVICDGHNSIRFKTLAP